MATVEADLRGSRLAGQRGDRAAPSPSAFQPPVRQSGLARRGGEPAAHPSLLHVTNGESAANTLRQTGIGGAVLPWQDALHEGPAPAGSRLQLLETRASFLSECGWGSRRALLASLERRDSRLVGAMRDGLQVVLWFEHDLYDQLQLLDVLTLTHEKGLCRSWSSSARFRGSRRSPAWAS